MESSSLHECVLLSALFVVILYFKCNVTLRLLAFFDLQVEVWRKKRVEERQYTTSYKWIVEQAKQGFLYKIFGVFGPKYRKLMFVLWQFVYTTAAMLIGYSSFHRYVCKYNNTVLIYCDALITFIFAAVHLLYGWFLYLWLLLATMEHHFTLMSLVRGTILKRFWKTGPSQRTNYPLIGIILLCIIWYILRNVRIKTLYLLDVHLYVIKPVYMHAFTMLDYNTPFQLSIMWLLVIPSEARFLLVTPKLLYGFATILKCHLGF